MIRHRKVRSTVLAARVVRVGEATGEYLKLGYGASVWRVHGVLLRRCDWGAAAHARRASPRPPGGRASAPRRATTTPRQTVYPDAFPGTGNLDFMKFGDAALDSLIEALKYRRGR